MKKPTFIPLNFSSTPKPNVRLCDQEGCEQEGEFRAPKSPHQLKDYYWFCLDHVKEYNKTWDFYKGMSSVEIEESRISDVTWNRPSWPVGTWRRLLENARYFDGLDSLFNSSQPHPALPKDVQKALVVLDITLPITLEALKKQYKKLAKKHHPDLHAGDKVAEERLKDVNEAYQIMKNHLS